ncbi:MAG TPA: peptidylprolyl isomerase [Bryobacteraceae bacterium]|nr:peptidylprolyl isomerase [Bryobacteraceae bacterium]
MSQGRKQYYTPTRKEIDYYYKTHRSRFFSPERIRVAHIVKNVDEWTSRDAARAVLEQAQDELMRGEGFDSVARRHSDCGSNGELSWFSRGVMVEEFDEAAFCLEKGETSSIFETSFGFHIVRVLDKRPAGIAPLSEVYDEISALLSKEPSGKIAANQS